LPAYGYLVRDKGAGHSFSGRVQSEIIPGK